MSQRLRVSALVAAFVAPALLYRGLALAAADLSPRLADLAGFISDLAVGLSLAALSGVLLRVGRLAVAIVLGIWLLACAGNHEHVRVLGANVGFGNLHYLTDRTFLLGSATAIDLFPLIVALLLCAVPAWLLLRESPRELPLRRLTIAALILLVVALFLPRDAGALRWRQNHFLLENLQSLASGTTPSEEIAARMGKRAELSGESWLPTSGRAANVLWLVLEGVSAAHVAPLARAQGWESSYEMPALSALSRQSVAYTNFWTMQRQTNRGLYAMLCGDLPRLEGGTPRMSEYARRGGEACLPARLAESGYLTAFVQAAPLGFMMKDQFMPRAGFERTIGAEYFRKAYRRSRWGVDDRAFLEQSLGVIDELRDSGRPWFITLLTSGTHHPFNVPQSFESRFPADSHRRAAQYLDRAVGEFIEALRERSLLEETLVIITSDESVGARLASDERAEEWSQNWGLALLLTPGAAPQQIATPFAQFDLPLSVLDYLALDAVPTPFAGRSIFRDSDQPRPIVVGNGYLQRVAALAEDERMITCDRGQAGCRTWQVERLRPFAAGARLLEEGLLPPPPFLAEALAQSRAPLRASAVQRGFALLRPGTLTLESESEGFQWIFGGQHFEVPPATRLEVTLDLRLVGEKGQAGLIHDCVADGDQIFRRELPIDAGQRVRLAYSYTTAKGLADTVVRLWTRPDRPPTAGLRLEVTRADVRLLPAAASDDARPDAFELLHFELSRP